ncbi:hypothetical protein PaG_01659 [Moesziomyces aphidis]|uniref:Uncharacterized protein n=1 Tax=Moesziomyces aphidis TaxID=84754 RepID=W3VNY7_MOEAP|nr:hypothetical protein PaG_01659 [Moesziomyces aphidis]
MSEQSSSHRYASGDVRDEDDVASWESLSDTSDTSSTSSKPALAKLPTLPDLRFEQSYIATIRGFLHEDSPNSADADTTHGHEHKVKVTRPAPDEHTQLWLGNLRVEWSSVLWVTVRDQLLSPLVQGAVWGVGGILLTQFRQYFSATSRSAGAGGRKATPQSSVMRSLGLSKR